jgi:hypothetical protein
MEKLKVSFDIVDNWDKDHFRLFIEGLNKNDTIDLYLITLETDQDIVDAVQAKLDLNDDHVIMVATEALKLDEIEDKAIRIHLDADYTFASTLYDTIGRYGIYVSRMWDFFNMRMKYITSFEFRVKQIIDAQENC